MVKIIRISSGLTLLVNINKDLILSCYTLFKTDESFHLFERFVIDMILPSHLVKIYAHLLRNLPRHLDQPISNAIPHKNSKYTAMREAITGVINC
jgi:hypothetical protein